MVTKKNEWYLVSGIYLLVFSLGIYFLGEIILPFLFALLIAYMLNPLIHKIQRRIPNRNIATTLFLTLSSIVLIGGSLLLGKYVIEDTSRLVKSVNVFVEENKDEINSLKEQTYSLVGEVYQNEKFQEQLDSLQTNGQNVDTGNLITALENSYAFFTESTDEDTQGSEWNKLTMLLSVLIYLFPILYTYDYFQAKYEKYSSNEKYVSSKIKVFFDEFKKVFGTYYRQRSIVVLISSFTFITTFIVMDLPGAIIIGLVAGLCTYASHFHYLTLPPIAIGCWVLELESGSSFYIYFGIVLAVFILISVLDETIFYFRIMKSVNGMNPALIILSFVLWVYLFGAFFGSILALPLTTVVLIYIDRLPLDQTKTKEPGIE